MTEFVVDYVRYSVNTSSPSDGAFIINSVSPPLNWNLVIPATVTYNSVTYSVKKIEYGAFENLANIKSVTIPNSLTEIGDVAFSSSGLTNVVSWGGVTHLGYRSFDGAALTSVTLPNDRDFTYGVGYDGYGNVFKNCASLTSVTYGSMMTWIPANMFYNSGLRTITNYGAITSIQQFAFSTCRDWNQDFVIPDAVTNLGRGAFGTSGLTKVTIGAGVTHIQPYVFEVAGLINVIFNGNNIPTIDGQGNFGISGNTAYYKTGATNVSRLTPQLFTNVIEGLPGNFSAPQNVTGVGGNQTATISWTAVTSSTTITKYRISYYNTLSSSTITTVDVSGNITQKEITGLTNGQTYSFSVKAYSGDYVSVASSSVTVTPIILYAPSYLGVTATSGVLNSVLVDWASDTDPNPTIITKYQISYYPIDTPSSITTVDVNRVSGRYQSKTISGLTNAKTFVFSIKAFINSTSSAASYSVNGTPNFSLDYLTYGVNPLDGYAFVLSNISPPLNWDLELPSTVTCSNVAIAVNKIGANAFSYVSSLRNITIPNSVTEIEAGAFSYSGLTNVVSWGGVTYIGQSAFQACGLQNVTFPDNRIINLQFNTNGNGLFRNCTSLTSVRYGNLMTEIPNFTFQNCTSLTSFTNYGALTQISDGAFENTNLNQEFIIPDSVTYLGPAFYHSGITKVTFACSQITTIGPNTFNSRTNELMTVIFDVNNIPIIYSTGNFNAAGDTAYYRTGATNVSRLTPFFTNIVEGLPGNFSAPQNVTGVGGNQTATISWTAVTLTAPDTITKYQISYYNTLSSSTITNVDVSGNITEKEITGLTNGQTYRFTVKAYSGVSVSLPSSSVTVTPFSIVKPEGNIAIAGISSATVIWLAVSVPSPNTITKYQINYFDTSTPSIITTVDVSGNITQKVITGLTPFQRYIFRIRAYVNSSAGTVSDDNSTTTPYLLLDSLVYKYNPSAPSDGVVVQNNDSPPSNWNLVIPATVTTNGVTYNVKKVNDYALQNVASLRNLTIPNSVTEIGMGGFKGSGLTNVVSWGGVTKINIFAFAETALQNITFPNDRDITVHWPGLGSDIFKGCTSLTSVTYGSMITEIGDRMFKDCTSLTSFSNYGGLTAIRGAVFENCNLNQEFIIPDSVSVLDSTALAFSGINKVTIGGLITNIANATFYTSQGRLLTAIFKGNDIPFISSTNNFNSTGDTAYYKPGATNVSRLTPFFDNIIEGLPGDFSAPQNVTGVGGNQTATISWTAVTSSTTITKYRISYYNTLSSSTITTVDVSGNITQKEITGLTNGQTYGFSIKAYSGDYMSVASSSVTVKPFILYAPSYLGVTATSDVLNSVLVNWASDTDPDRTIITKYQVSYYELTTPSSITTVDVNRASGTYQSTTISGLANAKTFVFSVKAFVNSVSSAASYSVNGTPNFSLDYLTYGVIPLDGNAFVISNILPPSNWDLVIPATVTCSGITYNVKKVNVGALANVASLRNLTIPNSVTEIGDAAFVNSGLTNVVSWGGVTHLGYQAFMGSALNSITLPNDRDFTYGGGYNGAGSTFRNCGSLTSVTYGSMMTTIPNFMFQNCTSLTSFTNYGALIQIIADSAFENTNLNQDFIIPNSVTYLGGNSFDRSGITKVTFACSQITAIAPSTFKSRSNELMTVIFDVNNIPNISSTGNFNAAGDTAYYRPGATNVSRLTPFFTNVVEGLPGNFSAPQNVTGVAGNQTATISWTAVTLTAPDTITKYQISYYNTLSSSTITNVDVSGNITEKEITGLTNGQTYRFTVKAYSGVSVSLPSSSVTTTPYSIDAPQNVTGTAGISAATISWTSVTSSTTITKYQISYYNVSTPSSITTVDVSANLTEIIITGLTNFQTYGFLVKAFVNSFSSDDSTIVNVTPYSIDAPQNVTGTAGISAATISWTSVTSSTTITKYQISYYNVSTPSSITTVDVSANLTEIIITGLTNFQTYGFLVKAFVNSFSSDDSTIVNVTPYSIDAPQNVTGTAGISAATISWSAVSVLSPNTITKYQISYYNTVTSSSITTVDVSGNLTEKEITGLTINNSYGFSVKAIVNSLSSVASSSVTVELSASNILNDVLNNILNNPTAEPPTPTFFYDLITTGFTTQELLSAGVTTIPITTGEAITNLLENFDFPSINITSDISIPSGILQSKNAAITLSNLTNDIVVISKN